MSEIMFVRKVALLSDSLLPLRYFKWRGSKDLRVGIYPFLKVPQLPPQEEAGGKCLPQWLKGRENRKVGEEHSQAFTQLTFQPWTPSDTGNIHHRAKKVKEAPNESANPTSWMLSALQARTLGGCSWCPVSQKGCTFWCECTGISRADGPQWKLC